MSEPTPCLVCGKELPSAMSGSRQPYGATTFTSTGQYGSTQFDEMDGSFLEINICSDCLTEAAQKGLVMIGRRDHIPPVLALWEQWNPWPMDTNR